MEKQEGRGILIILIIVAAVALLVWWIAKNGYEIPSQTADSGIKNSQDLDNLATELDSTDLNQMDPDIKELEKESSGF